MPPTANYTELESASDEKCGDGHDQASLLQGKRTIINRTFTSSIATTFGSGFALELSCTLGLSWGGTANNQGDTSRHVHNLIWSLNVVWGTSHWAHLIPFFTRKWMHIHYNIIIHKLKPGYYIVLVHTCTKGTCSIYWDTSQSYTQHIQLWTFTDSHRESTLRVDRTHLVYVI